MLLGRGGASLCFCQFLLFQFPYLALLYWRRSAGVGGWTRMAAWPEDRFVLLEVINQLMCVCVHIYEWIDQPKLINAYCQNVCSSWCVPFYIFFCLIIWLYWPFVPHWSFLGGEILSSSSAYDKTANVYRYLMYHLTDLPIAAFGRNRITFFSLNNLL